MSRARSFGVRLRLLALVVAWFVGGCTEDSPCGPDEQYRDGYCWTVDAGVAASDAEPAGEAGSASPFGQTCATSDSCVAPTEYCAVQPGQPAGFCTAFGCDLDPGVCPMGWGCMDLTPFGLPQHICIPGS